jgi:hypothetical protein
MSERPDDLQEMPAEPPLMVILSGPSGAGKDSVRELLLAWEPGMHRVVTATTRQPRPGEVEGRDYHFISEAVFDELLSTGGFIEHAFVYDHRIAMCFATLGLKVPGMRIRNPNCVDKTFPNFFAKLAAPRPDGIGATVLDAKTGQALSGEALYAG